ncbi:hypothetical protein BRI6_1941 [plant metagenome]|uniref:Uncharacterized protein n=1 Tax=plant metagenome TaxID=1297885 RepID=A0A484UM16_9ZZZZ
MPWQLESAEAGSPLRTARAQGHVLVFGLDWQPLLGRDVPRLALARARGLRASHYVWSAGQGASVGCARLRRPRARRREAWLSAAVAARLAAGTPSGVVLLALEAGCVWLSAWHAGAVLADSDRVHDSRASADAALDALAVRYPGLARFGNVPMDGGWQLLEAAQVLAAAGDAARLLPVVSQRRRALAGLAGTSLALAVGWRALRPVAPARIGTVAVDPAQAWADALDRHAASVPWHGPAALARALSALRALPASVTGWFLRDAQCLPRHDGWHCQARYARGTLGRNLDLVAVAPPGWAVQFDLLDGARLTWVVAHDGAGVPWRRLGSARDTELVLASRLQRHARLFSAIRVDAWQVLPLAPPADAQGAALTWPEDWPAVGTRQLTIEGPLYAYALLQDWEVAAAWQSLQLQVQHPSDAALAARRATVRLQGVLYEKH